MKQFKKCVALAAAMLIGLGTATLPAAALDIAPYEVLCESAGENAVKVAFTGLNSSVKAFQVSFLLDGPIEPTKVDWGSQILPGDLQEWVYDEATRTLHLYVVSDKGLDLVVNHRLEIGTIRFAAKSDANRTGSYKIALSESANGETTPGNIVFVDNTNETLQSVEAPKWQGQNTFTYKKKGSSGGSNNSDNSNDSSSGASSSKPVVEPTPTPKPVVPGKPAVTTPATVSEASSAPAAPSSLPEASSAAPPSSASSEPSPPEVSATAPVEQEPTKAPILPLIIGGVLVAAAGVAIYIRWQIVFKK